jgi:hypothetical protein
MSRRRPLLPVVLTCAWACAAALEAPAAADTPAFRNVRALGMGGALRAAATGDAGPLLNPSGMSLVRGYVAEGAYNYARPGTLHAGRLSIVDSTSGFNVAGGLYYSYLTANLPGDVDQSGHEGGLALSFPLGERILLGATAKYARVTTTPMEGERARASGVTFDVGTTVRPIPSLAIAAVGHNLRDLASERQPLALGFGAAFSGVQGLLVTFDGFLDLTRADETRGRELTLSGGAEYVFAQSFALRGGGGRDGRTGNPFGTLGVSVLGDVGALDAGARQDLSGDGRVTVIGVSGRLFVPTP